MLWWVSGSHLSFQRKCWVQLFMQPSSLPNKNSGGICLLLGFGQLRHQNMPLWMLGEHRNINKHETSESASLLCNVLLGLALQESLCQSRHRPHLGWRSLFCPAPGMMCWVDGVPPAFPGVSHAGQHEVNTSLHLPRKPWTVLDRH